MENFNVVNDTQTPVVEASEISGAAQSGSSEQTADVAPRPQSAEENARFRKMRLEIDRLKDENEQMREREIEARMQRDLADIREMDESVQSLSDLGEDFADLIAAGVSAPVAFAAVRQLEMQTMPPSTGAVEAESSAEKDFYLPQEVDALSPEQLDDPEVWKNVRNSMTKW